MCVGIGILIWLLPLVLLVGALLGYKFGQKAIDKLEGEDDAKPRS